MDKQTGLPPGVELAAIFDLLPAAIYAKDADGRYLYINQTASRFLHSSPDEIVGRHDHELFPAAAAEQLHQADLEVIRSGKAVYFDEILQLAEDNSPHHFWTARKPLRNREGDVVGMLGMSLDIHALKEKEQQLAALENQYRTTLKALPDLMFEVDLEGRYLDCHTPRNSLLAAPREQLIGNLLTDILPPEAAQTCMAAIAEAHHNGHSSGRQYRLALPEGDCWFELSVAPKQTAPGETPRFIALARDISARKQAEIALEKKEALLRAVLDNTPLDLWARDLDGYCIMENAALVKRWGSLLGLRPEDTDVPRESLARWQDNNRRAYAGEIINSEVSYLIDGQQRIFHNVVAPIREGDRITGIVGYNQDITERKQAEQQIRNLAFFDPLTDLPNRRLMFDRLTHARSGSARRQRQGALLLIDLDNFKQLNDTMGHDAGDHLLRETAHRLLGGIRQMDTAARLGGDEFVVILEDLDRGEFGAMQAEKVAMQLQHALRAPYHLTLGDSSRALNYYCTCSIGITLFQDDADSNEELLRRADTALYQAKAAGRNAVRFFDPEMQAAVAARAALEADLRIALEQQQFVLHYQPQVNSDCHMTGAEALVRWQHPQRGLVPPNDFIPVAEETGLIVELGAWVLETACRQLCAWRSQPDTGHLMVCVNVSARQFNQPQFIQELDAVLKTTGAPPQRLKLELTESLLLDHSDAVIKRITDIRALGVSFALDDFGTGYSSLSYLKRLPLDQLKIDRSFVRDILTDPNDAIIARTIVALGESLGLEVIAEGVETAEQQRVLANNGCHLYQGYLYGKPMTIEQFEQTLRNHRDDALIGHH